MFSDEIDTDRVVEAHSWILSLTLHGLVWKRLDWDVTDLLREKVGSVDAQSWAKSVVVTEKGERLSREFSAETCRPTRVMPSYRHVRFRG
jgi:hypothetical protein